RLSTSGRRRHLSLRTTPGLASQGLRLAERGSTFAHRSYLWCLPPSHPSALAGWVRSSLKPKITQASAADPIGHTRTYSLPRTQWTEARPVWCVVTDC